MKYEIWLGEHHSHFDHGVAHMDDGSTIPLVGCVHLGTVRDTLLIDREDRYKEMRFPVRWYIRENGLSLYGWADDVAVIVFHNDAGKDLEVRGFGTLKAGETRELRKEG